ncbi:MAG: tryptophan synthase subunit alpha [Oligosphaeraceae bacterium]
MDRIASIFQGKKPLVVFTTVGYPSLERSREGLEAAIRNGADILELGVPFSDPMADGPVIASASQKASDQGVTLEQVMEVASQVRRAHPDVGLVLFSYMNPLYHYGLEKLCQKLAALEVDAILPVDLPLEEREELLTPCRRNGLHLIPLVSPLTPPERATEICRDMTGFVYAINVAGVTGARKTLPPDLPGMMRRLKQCTSLPVASGFGIASRESAREAAACADGVIAGSGFVRALEQDVETAGRFVRELAEGIAEA